MADNKTRREDDGTAISRREALERTGLFAAGLALGGGALGGTPVFGASHGTRAHDYGLTFGAPDPEPAPGGRRSAQNNVTIALIGCGGQGNADLNAFMNKPGIKVAAVCDPDEIRMRSTAANVEKKLGARPEEIKDFRKLLDRKDLAIDAVIIGTPDHWHALPMVMACDAGKDVFCEKPISHNIVEGRRMVEFADKTRRVVQVGTWQRSSQQFLDAIAYVRAGKIGKINVCRAWKVQDPKAATMGKQTPKPPPTELDYRLWVGPAEMLPYQENRCHYNFRWYFNYAGGMTGDWGVHMMDTILQGMSPSDDLVLPTKVMSLGGKLFTGDSDDRTTPDTQMALMEFPGWMLHWEVHVGSQKVSPNGQEASAAAGRDHGALFIGSDGCVLVDRSGWSIFDANGKPVEKPAPIDMGGRMGGLPTHVDDMIACMKSRGKTRSNIASMHQTTTVCHLANLAYQHSGVLHWDPAKEVVTNDKKAMTLPSYQRVYRNGWNLPKA